MGQEACWGQRRVGRGRCREVRPEGESGLYERPDARVRLQMAAGPQPAEKQMERQCARQRGDSDEQPRRVAGGLRQGDGGRGRSRSRAQPSARKKEGWSVRRGGGRNADDGERKAARVLTTSKARSARDFGGRPAGNGERRLAVRRMCVATKLARLATPPTGRR